VSAHPPNLGDGKANEDHLGYRESVAANDVAVTTCGLDIVLDMRECVVDPIQATVLCGRPAINAWFFDHLQNFKRGEVAGVNLLIRFAKECGAASLCLTPPFHARNSFGALLWGQRTPSLPPPVATFLSGTMALPTLVRQTHRAALVAKENIRRSGQFSFTAIANTIIGLRRYSIIPLHNGSLARPPFSFKDGPHWQLPWKIYPKQGD